MFDSKSEQVFFVMIDLPSDGPFIFKRCRNPNGVIRKKKSARGYLIRTPLYTKYTNGFDKLLKKTLDFGILSASYNMILVTK